jgi:putative DNA primase/helicase
LGLEVTFLFDFAHHELEVESSIDLAVIAERGYESIHRPTNGDQRQRERLTRLQIPTWATREDSYFPGLLIPMYGPTGRRVSCQWKPRRPAPNRDGKEMRYASPKGQASRLDVHPRNRDKIADPTVELWIIEGIKKGDSLTSRGLCVVSLTGVFNWRSQLGTLGDWEDVPLKGRSVTICFDADAKSNPNVLRAMVRLGNWLKSKSVKQVRYLIVPSETHGIAVKGADDFFAAGGTIEELKAAATTAPPRPDTANDIFSDARLAETVADDVLTDQVMWVSGLDGLGLGRSPLGHDHQRGSNRSRTQLRARQVHRGDQPDADRSGRKRQGDQGVALPAVRQPDARGHHPRPRHCGVQSRRS